MKSLKKQVLNKTYFKIQIKKSSIPSPIYSSFSWLIKVGIILQKRNILRKTIVMLIWIVI